jgi:hypothetical protein
MSETNPKTKTNKVATREYFVLPDLATAYLEATSEASRDGTSLGVFITAIDALTLGVLRSIEVGERFDTNQTPPAATVFAFDFDQFLISSRDTVTTDPVKTSIPARKDSAITIESDGVTVPLTGPNMSAFVTAYEALVLSLSDNPIDVLRATISE